VKLELFDVYLVFGRPLVKRFALCYQTVVCLSVMVVYCGQMVGWIKMKLGTEVDLGPGHTVLDGAHLPPDGAQQPPSFRHMSVVAKRSPISATAKLLLV